MHPGPPWIGTRQAKRTCAPPLFRTAVVLGLQRRLCQIDLRSGPTQRPQQLWQCQPGQYLSALASPSPAVVAGVTTQAGLTATATTEHLLAVVAGYGSGSGGGSAGGSSVLLFDLRRPHVPLATWQAPLLDQEAAQLFTLLDWAPARAATPDAGTQQRWGGVVVAAGPSGLTVGCTYHGQVGRRSGEVARGARMWCIFAQPSGLPRPVQHDGGGVHAEPGRLRALPGQAAAEAAVDAAVPGTGRPALEWEPAHAAKIDAEHPPWLLAPPLDQQALLESSIQLAAVLQARRAGGRAGGRAGALLSQGGGCLSRTAPELSPTHPLPMAQAQLDNRLITGLQSLLGMAVLSADWATKTPLGGTLLCGLTQGGDVAVSTMGAESLLQATPGPTLVMPADGAGTSSASRQLQRPSHAGPSHAARALPHIPGVPDSVLHQLQEGQIR